MGWQDDVVLGHAEILAGGSPGKYAITRTGIRSMGTYCFTWQGFNSVSIVTEENRHRVGRTVGTAAVGALLLGPLGLFAGGFLGKKNLITYMCISADGKSLLLQSDNRTFTEVAKILM